MRPLRTLMTTGALDILHFCYMGCQLETLSLPENQHLLHLTVLMILLLHTAHTVLVYLNCTYFVSVCTSPHVPHQLLQIKPLYCLLNSATSPVTANAHLPAITPVLHPSDLVSMHHHATGLHSSGHQDLSHSIYQTECPHQEAFSAGSFAASS